MWIWSGDISFNYEKVNNDFLHASMQNDRISSQMHYRCEMSDADVSAVGMDRSVLNCFRADYREYDHAKIISTSSMDRDDKRP